MTKLLSYTLHIQCEDPAQKNILLKDGQCISSAKDSVLAINYLTDDRNRMMSNINGIKILKFKSDYFIHGHLLNLDIYDRHLPYIFGINTTNTDEIVKTLTEAIFICKKEISQSALSDIKTEIEKIKKNRIVTAGSIFAIILTLIIIAIWIIKK